MTTQLILLSDEQAAQLYGISRRTFQALRREPWMPKPIVLGPRLLRWSYTELQDAIAHMPRQQQPGDSVRAKIEKMKRGPP